MTNAENYNHKDPQQFTIEDLQIIIKEWPKQQNNILSKIYPQDSGNFTLLNFKSNT